jgi:hypothetical protein
LDKLSKGEKLVGGGSAVLLILSFFSLWWKVEIDTGGLGGGTLRGNAWESGLPIFLKLALILAIAALVLVGLKASGTSITLPVTWGLAYTAIGGLIFLCLLLTVLMGPEDGGAGLFGVEVSRGILMLVSPIVGAVIAYGGYMHMQGEGSTMPGATTPPAA